MSKKDIKDMTLEELEEFLDEIDEESDEFEEVIGSEDMTDEESEKFLEGFKRITAEDFESLFAELGVTPEFQLEPDTTLRKLRTLEDYYQLPTSEAIRINDELSGSDPLLHEWVILYDKYIAYEGDPELLGELGERKDVKYTLIREVLVDEFALSRELVTESFQKDYSEHLED